MMAAVQGEWAIFREDTAGWRVRQFFLFLLFNGNFMQKTFGACGGSGLSRRSVQPGTAFVCDRAEKPPKENMAAAAMAEYGYGRESETDRIPVVISRTTGEKTAGPDPGFRGYF